MVLKVDGTIEISGVQLKISGVTITSEASAIHTIKGSLVKIN